MWVFILSSSAQDNINMEFDCSRINSAIFSQTIIDCLGKETVSYYLERNIQFRLLSEIDSMGNISQIFTISSNSILSDTIVNKLKSFVLKKQQRYPICVSADNLDYIESKKRGISIREYLHRKKYFLWFNFPMLGFNSDYDPYSKKCQEKTIPIFDCYQEYINKYLPLAQINVSIDSACLIRNSATISKAMIEALGKDSVEHLLNNQTNITFVCNVDSLGYIKNIEKIRSKQELSDNFAVFMENYLGSNKIRFYICYVKDPPEITNTDIIEYAREYFKNSKSKVIGFGFPGELMNLYEYEKEKAREEGICLSKYDYLLMQISRFS
jgi:hypothetical protein